MSNKARQHTVKGTLLCEAVDYTGKVQCVLREGGGPSCMATGVVVSSGRSCERSRRQRLRRRSTRTRLRVFP